MEIDYIIGLYLNGQASKEQLRILNDWIEESSDNARALSKIEIVWKKQPKRNFYFNEDEVSDRVWNRLHLTQLSKRRFLSTKSFFRNVGIFFLAAFSFLLYRGLQNDIHQQSELSSSTMPIPEYVIKSNPRGVKSTIKLPDGSTVILNTQSFVKYNFQPDDTIRLIELKGEAFFKVKKDAERPFVVQAGKVRTVALGTEFNVKSYSNEEVTNVALHTGKVQVAVQVGQQKESFYLDPGQFIEYDGNKDKVVKNTFNYKDAPGWTEGIISFKKDSLQQVLAELSRWYDVDFELRNYNGTPWRYTGDFKDEYLDVVLKNMSYSQHFDYEISEGIVIINFKN